VYAPYVKQEEPLQSECQHFLDCIKNGTQPLSDGKNGLELVRILEASSRSLQLGGAPVEFPLKENALEHNGNGLPKILPPRKVPVMKFKTDKRSVKMVKKVSSPDAPEIFVR